MLENLRKALDLLTPRERRLLPWVLATMVFTAVLELVGVGSIFPFLSVLANPDVVAQNGVLRALNAWAGLDGGRDFLAFLGVSVLGLIVLTQFSAGYSRWVLVRFNYQLEHDLGIRVLDSYLRRPYGFYLNRNTADLNRILLQEVGLIIAGIVNPVLSFVSAALIALAIVGYLLFLQPLITFAILALVAGGYGFMHWGLRRWLHSLGEERNRANEERFRLSAEAFGGIKALKARGLEDSALRRYTAPSLSYSRTNTKVRLSEVLPGYFMRTLTFGGLIAVLLVLLLQGQTVATILPLMGAFAFAGYRLMPSLEVMLTAFAEFQFREDLLRKIHADVRAEPVPEPPAPIALPFEREIRVRGVSFRYPAAESLAVAGLDLAIPKNTSIGFVGPTGGGKTTILDLLLGLHSPTDGSIEVDGVERNAAALPAWQRLVGYVPQEIFLADDTVAHNIAFGLGEEALDMEAVVRAARTAHIHDFIENELPDGYETRIGERGIRLSGGQRQRIGIARALYQDPPILFFDEATSDIDTVTEADITRAIRELSGRKTIITVAHRLTTIRDCDAIYVIERGRVAAQGRYEELVASSPAFQRFLYVKAEVAP